MYVVVIIRVNIVVHAVYKYARIFNPSSVHIKMVGFVKVWWVFYGFIFRELQIDFVKVREIYVVGT